MKVAITIFKLFISLFIIAILCGYYSTRSFAISSPNNSTVNDRKIISSDRVVVPIHQLVINKKVIRYFIPITIGHTKLNAMLDTGSPGIWVLPGAVNKSDLNLTKQSTAIHYGSGVKLKGVVAKAMIGIGAFHSIVQIPIDAVQKIGCTSKHPNCAASRVSQQDYRLGGAGSPNKGFKVIIGVNLLAHAKVNNPLPEIGIHKWIIILPKPGDGQPGSLILNPNIDDLAGFTQFKLDLTNNPRDGIPSRITNMRTNKQVSGLAMLDTGMPSVHVVTRELKRKRIRFKKGDEAKISFISKDVKLAPMTFTADASGPTRVKVSLPKGSQPNSGVFAGILPYFNYRVLYDSDNGVIGLKHR